MSKKKATMTLKDFHGGSIPSDLRLPSAPGVTVRPADQQQSTLENSMGRYSNRLRPASAGSARTFDDKTLFFSHNARIGRNFDEDERKPLDGTSASRRTVSDESIHSPQSHIMEAKTDNLASGKVCNQPSIASSSQLSSGTTASSYAARLSEVHNVGSNKQNFGGRGGVNSQNVGVNFGPSGSYSNPWGVNEVAAVTESVSAPWSCLDAEVKLAHASAVEKVSSGRWHSQHIHPSKDVEIVGHLEAERESYYRGNDMYNRNNYNGIDVLGGPEYRDVALAMPMETNLIAHDTIHTGEKEISSHGIVRSTMPVEPRERNSSIDHKEFQPLSSGGVSGETELRLTGTLETSERPKLKLLPRTKPLENSELPVDYKQGQQQPNDAIRVIKDHELYKTAKPLEPGYDGSMTVNRVVERPKLNLKPCSQSLEQPEGNNEIKRNTLFAGARPREVVLKEQGIDGDIVKQYDSQLPSRIMQDVPKIDPVISQITAAGYNVKAKSFGDDQRIVKSFDRNDQRMDTERANAQRRYGENENRRNFREVKKHSKKLRSRQQQQERPPSPDTWRKPVEDPKAESTNDQSQYPRKVASALELAQAFSTPVSDPTIPDRLSGVRGIPSRGPVPFSRLIGPSPKPQINGY